MSRKNETPAARQTAHFREKLSDMTGMTLKEISEKFNLLGYDNGDGEISCCKLDYNANTGLPEINPLSFKENIFAHHIPNIIAFAGEEAILVDKDLVGDASRRIYLNFKRCPGRGSEEKYKRDNEEADVRYTYEHLMGHSFACALKKLFACNPVIDRKKRTLILVGRPSGKYWESAEQKYAQILCRYLKEKYYLPDVKITILVLPESLAAMAGSLGMTKKTWLETFAQILDLGSSTFDITTITPKGVDPNGEDSFQFGGNQLDEVMVKYGDYQFYEDEDISAGETFGPDPRKKAKLRFCKEKCYGENGSNLCNDDPDNCYHYLVFQNGQPVLKRNRRQKKQNFEISADIMEVILSNTEELSELRCVPDHLTQMIKKSIRDRSSWADACEFVMRQFHDKTKHLLPGGKPGRLILTGGVSNMPEVRKIAEQVFGVKPEQADKPSLTVSNGLALILGWEIIKSNRVNELLDRVDNLLPGEDSLLEEMVKAFTAADQSYYQAVIEKWAGDVGVKTLGDCVEMMADSGSELFRAYDNCIESAVRSWFSAHRISERLRNALTGSLEDMFLTPAAPGAEQTWDVPMPDLSSAPVKELKNDYPLNIHMFFDASNCPADPYDLTADYTPAQRRKILEVYKSHAAALARGGEFDCGHEKATLPGIASVYENQLTSRDDAAPLRAYILEVLKALICDIVDERTYYLSAAVTN